MSDHENGGERDRANSDFIEESEFPIDIGGRLSDLVNDVPEEHDDAYVQVVVAEEAMNLLAHAIAIQESRGEELIDDIESPEAYKQSLSAALSCARAILDEADNNPALKEDLAGLNLGLLIEARGSLVHFARHLGVDINFPSPGASEDRTLDGPFKGITKGVSIDVNGDAGPGFESIAKVTLVTLDIFSAIASTRGRREWPDNSWDRNPEYVEQVNSLAEGGVKGRYGEELKRAMEIGGRILSKIDENPEVVQDISELDDELLTAARGSVQPVGRHLGIGIALPESNEGGC